MMQDQIIVSSSQLQAEAIRREMESREKLRNRFSIHAKEGFWEFCKYLSPNEFFIRNGEEINVKFFRDEKMVLREMANILHDTILGKYPNVAINMPPRTGKSFLTSIFIVWLLGHFPRGSIMRNAYSQATAEKFSRDVRSIIGLPNEEPSEITRRYRKIFPHVKLDQRKTAVEEWTLETSLENAYSCAGMQGSAKGKGATIAMFLDDPSKDTPDGSAETEHEKVFETYMSMHRSRLGNENVPQFLIMTRSHNEDLTGRIIPIEKTIEEGGTWKHFVYPLIVDTPEGPRSFCEAIRSTESALKEMAIFESQGASHIFDAVYMQDPSPKSGKMFSPDKIRRFRLHTIQGELARPSAQKFHYLDFADAGSNFLVSIVAIKVGQDYYIYDVVCDANPKELTEDIVAAQLLRTQPQRSIFESNRGADMYARLVRDKALSHGSLQTSFSMKLHSSNKKIRISTWAPQILERCVFLHQDDYRAGEDYWRFIKNLTDYRKDGKTKIDDAPDAMAGFAEGFVRDTEIIVRSF